ncbi:hypothetical protein HDF18_08450 [Mucilaginibacter sp. X5P1]|uniref:hypothetical protein n=1 Tax=Mucilaginibacter sp. X5P1 TaxID=2723088 RepID=UPI001622817B|nr:hypothetical protein [Mucilaginibacter sp. X5P1]MBB6137687.1 hypothetical protein [Mucilaginibacter sp. X5P1]
MAATSKFTPNSFFFTDPTALTQTAAQAFGPVSEDIYRLTSKFSFSADTDAFAICTGVVLVQPQTGNSGLVNLILRPFKQPITGFNIKYFVYRGLNVGDFFDGSNVIPASEDASDFINKINASFTAYYLSTGTTPPAFLASFIGFDPINQPATTLISDLFFKVTGGTETAQTAFELPLIAAGASLGTFASGECGLDIVLDYGDYKLPTPNDQFVFDLNYARAAEAKIDITNVSDDFQQSLLKEQIFQFLDAAAFYGFHVANGTVNLNNDGTATAKTGEDIYNSIIQNFNTKNSLYLYIQSDRTRSYNFYGNYNISDSDDNCLLTGFSADALSEQGYETNGWPVIILATTQSTSDPNIILYIQFVTDNNDNTVLYGQVGQIINAQGNNFSGPDDLQQDADDSGSQPNLTKIFQLSNPAVGTGGSKNYAASFNIIIYEGVQYDYVTQGTDSEGNPTTTTATSYYFDDIFDELNATAALNANDTSTYSSISLQRIKLINHISNNVQKGISAVQTRIVNDVLTTGDTTTPTVNRTIYISQSVNVFNNVVSVNNTISSDTQTTPSVSGSLDGSDTFQLPSAAYYNITQFTDNDNVINGVNVNSMDNTIPAMIILGIIKAENDQLLALIATNSSLLNVRIFLIPLFQQGNQLVSTEGILYQKYNVGIVGEDNTGTLQLKLTDSSIVVYSLDNRFYYSSAFSEYIQSDNSISSLALDLDISL